MRIRIEKITNLIFLLLTIESINTAKIGSIKTARITPNILTEFILFFAINNIALIIETKKIKPEIINIQSNKSMVISPITISLIVKCTNKSFNICSKFFSLFILYLNKIFKFRLNQMKIIIFKK